MPKQLVAVLLFLLLLILGWELASVTLPTLGLLLPPPTKVFEAMVEHFPALLFHTSVTLEEILFALFWSFLLSFPFAYAMKRSSTVSLLTQPLFVGLQSIPMLTLAPLMVLFFGWTQTAIVIPTVLMIFFPLTMTLYRGFTSVPKEFRDYFRIHGASAWQTFWKLELPSSIPYLFSGLRIATGISAISAVAGEWAGGQAGLGVLILEARFSYELPLMYGAIFCVMILSLSLYALTLLLEKILFHKWSSSLVSSF